MAALPTGEEVYLPAGTYLVSADLTGSQTVTFQKKSGGDGALRPIVSGGVTLTLTSSDPTEKLVIGAGEFLVATHSTGGLTVRAEPTGAV